MTSWFELNKNDDGQLTFSLKADNGDMILSSDKTYFSKGSAANDIKTVQSSCRYDNFYERQKDGGKHFFNLQAPDHRVLAKSPLFESQDQCEAAISLMKQSGTTNMIKEAC